VLDATAFLHGKPAELSWTQFVFKHMQSLGLCQTEDEHGLDNIDTKSFKEQGGRQSDLQTAFHDQISDTASSNRLTPYAASLSGHTVSVLQQQTVTQGRSAENKWASSEKTAVNCYNLQYSKRQSNDHAGESCLPHDVIVAINKSDLIPASSLRHLPSKVTLGADVCTLSCTADGGLDTFVTLLAARVKEL
jgi:hypothetical protein